MTSRSGESMSSTGTCAGPDVLTVTATPSGPLDADVLHLDGSVGRLESRPGDRQRHRTRRTSNPAPTFSSRQIPLFMAVYSLARRSVRLVALWPG